MKWWTAEDLTEVFGRLLAASVDFVIIGGQAVNLWSEHYQAKGQCPDAWAALQPFASRDLDLLGGRLEAATAAASLQVEVVLFEPKPRSTAPNSGTLYVPVGEEELIVQFLHTPFGVRREEMRATAQVLEWKGLRLPVAHPLLCLESKIECLYGLDQTLRRDLHHLRLCVLCVQSFVRDLLEQSDERTVLITLERLAVLATDELGLRVWREHGLPLEETLNLAALAEQAPALGKVAAFLEKRWPRLEAELAERRRRYARLGQPKIGNSD